MAHLKIELCHLESPVTDYERSLTACNTSQQFQTYLEMINEWDNSGENDFFNLTGCIPSCRRMRYKTVLMFQSNFDCLMYGNSSGSTPDNASAEVSGTHF